MKSLNVRLRKRESSAFVELYDLLGEKIFRYARSQLKSNADAADVVQEVFVKLVQSHHSLARAKNMNGYVFAIARNEVIRWSKKKKRRSQVETAARDRLIEVAESGSRKNGVESDDWIEQTLKHLAPEDREIVQLKIFSRLTFAEIGIVLNLQQSNIATRYRRAIKKLESLLEQTQLNTGVNNESAN